MDKQIVSLTGKDSIILNNRIFSGFANADVCKLEFPNNLTESKTGKNGNAIIAFNASGINVDITLRIIRGCADDKYLNSLMKSYIADPPSFTLLTGEFIKRTGDGSGNVSNEVYAVEGGSFKKMVNSKENTEGDTEQAISEYAINFVSSTRSFE